MRLDARTPAGAPLWAERLAGPGPVPVLLVADAGESGVAWSDALLARLARHHPVIRYDHRGTGRSAAADADADTGLADLAADALAVLDAAGTQRAHLVGLGLGGRLVQLLLLDHADRAASATLLCTGPLPGAGVPVLPGPTLAVRRLLAELDDPRDGAGELAWRLARRRLLGGATDDPVDDPEARAVEERVIAHAGTDEPVVSHADLDPAGPARGDELRAVAVPALVLEGPADPVDPPPSSSVLAELLHADLVTVAGLGHVVDTRVAAPVGDAILRHLARVPTL